MDMNGLLHGPNVNYIMTKISQKRHQTTKHKHSNKQNDTQKNQKDSPSVWASIY